MANYFRLATDSLTTTDLTTLFTVPATSTYIIGSIIVANTHASTNSTITITMTDDSESASVNIVTTDTINAGVSNEILTRPLILENGDILVYFTDDLNPVRKINVQKAIDHTLGLSTGYPSPLTEVYIEVLK